MPLVNQFIPDNLKKPIYQASKVEGVNKHLLLSLPGIKSLFIIRSDKLSGMDQLADSLPDIFNKRYELPPLDRTAAREAIVEPALLEGEFSTPNFTYSDECISSILDFLTHNNKTKSKAEDVSSPSTEENIEGFQLQLICQHAEHVVREKVAAGAATVELTKEDIGDLNEVTRTYYHRVLSGLKDPERQLVVQKLVEEGLIFDADSDSRRLTLFEGVIRDQYGVTDEELEYLGGSRLVRRLALPEGGFSYEISHDSLLAPILVVKAVRVEKEAADKRAREAAIAKAAETKKKAEEAKERRRRRTALFATILAVLTLLAFGGMGVAWKQSVVAAKEKQKADSLAIKADSLRLLAEKAAGIARDSSAISMELRAKALKIAKELANANMALGLSQKELEVLLRENLARAVVNERGWLKQLSRFDEESYSQRKYQEWRTEGAGIYEDFSLAPQTEDHINESGVAFLYPELSPEARVWLASRVLRKERNEVSEAVAASILKNGKLERQQLVKVLPDANPTSSEVWMSENDTVIFSGNAMGLVLAFRKSNRYQPDTLSGRHVSSSIYGSAPIVSDIALSSNSRFLATAGFDGVVYLYEVGTSIRNIARREYGEDYIRDIAFSPSGNHLFVAGDLGMVKQFEINSIERRGVKRGISALEEDGVPGGVGFQIKEQVIASGFGEYIVDLNVSGDGDRLVAGGHNGGVMVLEKQGNSWVKTYQDRIPSSVKIQESAFTGDTLMVVDNAGNLWLNHLTADEGWSDDTLMNRFHSPVVVSDKYRPSRFLVSDGPFGTFIFDVANGKKTMLMQQALPFSHLKYNSRTNLALFTGATELELIRFRRSEFDLSVEELVDNINLPELNQYEKLIFGKLSEEEITALPVSRKQILLDSLWGYYQDNFGNPGTDFQYLLPTFQNLFLEEFKGNYAQLMVSHLGDYQARRGTENGQLDSEMLLRSLQWIGIDLKEEEKFEKTRLFQASLVHGEMTNLSRWLYWAYKWFSSPVNDIPLRKYYGGMAYRAFPVEAWENMLMYDGAGEAVDHLVDYSIGTDVNSLAFQPGGRQIMVTSDVGYGQPSVTFLPYDLYSGDFLEKILPRPRDDHKSGYVWGATFSPNGNYAASISVPELIIWDTKSPQPEASFRLENEEFGERMEFLSDSLLMIMSAYRDEVYLVEIPKETSSKRQGTLSVKRMFWFRENATAAYHGEITDLVRQNDSSWIIGTTKGNIFWGSLDELNSSDYDPLQHEQQLYQPQDDEIVVMSLASLPGDSPGTDKLIAGLHNQLLMFDISSDFSLLQRKILTVAGTIRRLEHSADSETVFWLSDEGTFGKVVFGDERSMFGYLDAFVYDISLSPDGNRLAVGANDGWVRVYQVDDFSPLDLGWIENPDIRSLRINRTLAIKEDLFQDFSTEKATELWDAISLQR